MTSETCRSVYRYCLSSFEPLVSVGQVVRTGEPIAEHRRPGALRVIDVATELKRPAKSALKGLEKFEGDRVEKGSRLVRSTGPFGLGHRELESPVSGTVQAIIRDLGMVVLRSSELKGTITSDVTGEVVTVDEIGIAIAIAGTPVDMAFGFGPPVSGRMARVDSSQVISHALRNVVSTGDQAPPRIILFDGPVDADTLRLVREAFWDARPVAVIASAISHSDMRKVRAEGLAVSLLITEGFAEKSSDIITAETTRVQLVEQTHATVLPQKASVIIASQQDAPADETVTPEVTVIRGLELTRGRLIDELVGTATMQSEIRVPAARVAYSSGPEGLVPREDVRFLDGR